MEILIKEMYVYKVCMYMCNLVYVSLKLFVVYQKVILTLGNDDLSFLPVTQDGKATLK